MPHPDQNLARADSLPPAFACTTTHGGLDAAWVYVAGELDIATAPQLERTLHESQQLAHLTVLDLRELAFMDSAGVHTIVNASLRARTNGRRLVLVRGRPEIYRMFTLTGSTADVDIAGAAGQREHAVDLWAAAHEDQPAAVLPGPDAGVDDRVHARAVHEGELAQVEHSEVRQLLSLTQRSCELWCRR